MKIIAIIPARSGSKGLKDKNIKELNGKPLIAYTIQSALETNVFDEVMVSTDSEYYANIAKEYGAKVPFLRSDQLSSDNSSTWDAVREVLYGYKKSGINFDICILLQPTSPLRTATDILNALKLYNDKKAFCVVSVCQVEHPVQWCFPIDEDYSMKNFAISPFRNLRRQELVPMFRENGAIYIVNTELLISKKDIYEEKCYSYIMDSIKSIDIDHESDFKYASYLLDNM